MGAPLVSRGHCLSTSNADFGRTSKNLTFSGTKRVNHHQSAARHDFIWAKRSLRQRRGDLQVAQFKTQMPTEARLNKRISELATRELYLTNFWYAAAFSKQLSVDKPFRTRLLDTDVFLWRDELSGSGQVICVTARSPMTGLPMPSDQQIALTSYRGLAGDVRPAMCA